MTADTQAQIGATLRDLDRDRYYASLVVPAVHRPAIQALWTFNAEVAAISERVTEPAPGEIRLQWWADLLEGNGHGETAQNPVAAALTETIIRFGLPNGPLVRLLAARRFDLYQDPMPDVETFEGYVGETLALIFQYAAAVLDGGRMPPEGDAAGHLGVALSYLGHVRAFGYNASRGRIFLPLSIFADCGVGEADILGGVESVNLSAALGRFIELAEQHIVQARAAIDRIAPPVRGAFAQVALAGVLQRQARKVIGEPFARQGPEMNMLKIGALVLWSWRRNR